MLEISDHWASVYKFARLAFLGIGLVGIAAYIYHPSRRERLEEPAKLARSDAQLARHPYVHFPVLSEF